MSLEKPKPTIEVIVIQLKQLKQNSKKSKSFTVYGISLDDAFERVRKVFKK